MTTCPSAVIAPPSRSSARSVSIMVTPSAASWYRPCPVEPGVHRHRPAAFRRAARPAGRDAFPIEAPPRDRGRRPAPIAPAMCTRPDARHGPMPSAS